MSKIEENIVEDERGKKDLKAVFDVVEEILLALLDQNPARYDRRQQEWEHRSGRKGVSFQRTRSDRLSRRPTDRCNHVRAEISLLSGTMNTLASHIKSIASKPLALISNLFGEDIKHQLPSFRNSFSSNPISC